MGDLTMLPCLYEMRAVYSFFLFEWNRGRGILVNCLLNVDGMLFFLFV